MSEEQSESGRGPTDPACACGVVLHRYRNLTKCQDCENAEGRVQSPEEIAAHTVAMLIEGVDNIPGITLDARDGMGVTLHTRAQVKDWLTEEFLIAANATRRTDV